MTLYMSCHHQNQLSLIHFFDKLIGSSILSITTSQFFIAAYHSIWSCSKFVTAHSDWSPITILFKPFLTDKNIHPFSVDLDPIYDRDHSEILSGKKRSHWHTNNIYWLKILMSIYLSHFVSSNPTTTTTKNWLTLRKIQPHYTYGHLLINPRWHKMA